MAGIWKDDGMRTLTIVALAVSAGLQAAPAGGLGYTAPPAWKARPASSSMRVAEFVVTKAASDAEDAELIIYFFGSLFGRLAGGVDANIDRWISQMQQPDGSASKDKARRAEQTLNGLKVTTIDCPGPTSRRYGRVPPSVTTSRTSGCAPRWWKPRADRITSR